MLSSSSVYWVQAKLKNFCQVYRIILKLNQVFLSSSSGILVFQVQVRGPALAQCKSNLTNVFK